MDWIRRLTPAVAAGIMLLISPDGHTQDFFEQLFGTAAPSPGRASVGGYSIAPQYGEGGTIRSRAVVKSRIRRSSNWRGAQTAAAHSGAFCVRICDGYYFPLVRSGDLNAQQACQYGCPSASVAVYEGSSIETARNLAGDEYTSLPTAFSFRNKTTEKCSCNFPQPAQSFSLSVASNDPTLRTGDIVFGDHEAFVCRGSKLLALDRSSLRSFKIRENVRLMIAASRPRPAADLRAENAPQSVRKAPQTPAADAKIADDQPMAAQDTPATQSSEPASTPSLAASK